MKLTRRNFLALGAALALGGCTSRQAEPSAASASGGREEVTVTLLMPGSSSSAACARISERLSALTRSRYSFSVKIQQQPHARYEINLWQRLAEKQAPDLFFLEAARSLTAQVYEDNIYPLNVLLAQHSELGSMFSARQWSCKEKYRRIYAIPNGTTDCYCSGFIARQDIMQAIGVQPEEICSLSQLHDLLLQVKEKDPGVVPVVSSFGQVDLSFGQDPLDNDLGVLMNNEGTSVENLYASEEYAALCREMYHWRQEGLILPNACLRPEAGVDLLRGCNGFGFFARLNADTLSRFSRAYGGPLTPIRLGRWIQNSSGMPEGWALPVQPSHKVEAMTLLELLHTDTEAARIFILGEEADQNPAASNRWCNSICSLAAAGESQGITLEQAPFTSPAYGFSVNTTECLAEVDSCLDAVNCYNSALLSGCLDPAEALPLFLGELEEAGIGKVISAKQKRLDDWLAAR